MAWTVRALVNGAAGPLLPTSAQNPNWRVRNEDVVMPAAFEYQEDNDMTWHSVPLGRNSPWFERHCDLQVSVRTTAGAIRLEYKP